MAHELKKRKKLFERKSSIYIRRCARLPIHSSSQTQGKNYTVSELHHCITCSVKNTHFFTGKVIVTASKGILVSWCYRLMEEFFRLLWQNVNAYRKDRKCFKMVQTNGLSVKENANASECTAQNNSIFAFAFDDISSPSSFWDLWINFSSFVNV